MPFLISAPLPANEVVNPPMHIPDGFLSTPIAVIFYGLAIVAVALPFGGRTRLSTSAPCPSWACWRRSSSPAR
jgi:hypothetical protein